jgi:iron complex outermembrane receptor protein
MNDHTPIPMTTSRFGFLRAGFFLALPALGSFAIAQTTPAAAPAAAPVDNDVVQLSAFTVSTDKDVGYRASNSIAGTRTNTPIKDIPMNIQVFTKDLADDLIIKNQVDLEAYNASLVNGGADRFSDNVIQQSYQNFLFRGFRQNWGLRDGIREYDPIDTQSLSRVELIKGPAAPLYGLAYPGGVMNNISKTVDFAKNFASVRLTGGSEGDYRATLDANSAGTIGLGKVGVRVNEVYEKTEDFRAHSTGQVRMQNVVVDFQPTTSTDLSLMVEHKFSAKPGGLGYFSTGGEPGAPGNHSDIPLQIVRPDIPWNWNWSNGHDTDSLDTHLYRGKIVQRIGDQFQIEAYAQYSNRLEISGQGWDANGSGGADSWESAGSGYNAATNTITSTYHYRDWGNQMHAYGATGVYKLDFEQMKNTFAFGSSVWGEKELSRASSPLNPAASAIVYQANPNVPTPVPPYPPADLVPESTGGPNGNGYHHEDNSNDYAFINWQMSALDNRLKTNVGINKTNIKTVAWDNGASQAPNNVYTASKWSPIIGALFDVTKNVGVFAVHSTSLFPDSTKDSFGHQFSPQVGSSYEGGVKFDVADGTFSGTVSYYEITQTGGSQSDPNQPNTNTVRYDAMTQAQRDIAFGPGAARPIGDIIQGGEQKSKGVELDLVYQPIRQWQIVGSFAHVNHEFTQSAVPATIGETYPQAVKTRYSLLTKYTFTDGSMKNLMLGVGFTGGTKSLQDYINFNGADVARYEPGRNTLEVFGGYRIKLFGYSTMVQLNIKNLTKTPDYAGWKATGSSTTLATQRYEVPTPVIYRLTVGLDF